MQLQYLVKLLFDVFGKHLELSENISGDSSMKSTLATHLYCVYTFLPSILPSGLKEVQIFKAECMSPGSTDLSGLFQLCFSAVMFGDNNYSLGVSELRLLTV